MVHVVHGSPIPGRRRVLLLGAGRPHQQHGLVGDDGSGARKNGSRRGDSRIIEVDEHQPVSGRSSPEHAEEPHVVRDHPRGEELLARRAQGRGDVVDPASRMVEVAIGVKPRSRRKIPSAPQAARLRLVETVLDVLQGGEERYAHPARLASRPPPEPLRQGDLKGTCAALNRVEVDERFSGDTTLEPSELLLPFVQRHQR